MRAVCFSLIFIIAFCQISYSQIKDVLSISIVMDTTIYYELHYFEVFEEIHIPDSVKNKALNILNGYLPFSVEKRIAEFDNRVIKNIEKSIEDLCKPEDYYCIKQKTDSIRNLIISKERIVLQTGNHFTPNFILALGSWGVEEAIPILKENISNERFPKFETQLTLAKLGDNSSNFTIKNQLSLDYLLKTTAFQTDTLVLYDNFDIALLNQLINEIYLSSKYLKNKEFLYNLLDLIDLKGFYLSPLTSEYTLLEEEVLGCIYILFAKYDLNLCDKLVFSLILDLSSKPFEERKQLLTPISKSKIKRNIRELIDKSVNL